MGFSRQEYWSGVPLPSSSITWEARKKKVKVAQSFLALLPSDFFFFFFASRYLPSEPPGKPWLLLKSIYNKGKKKILLVSQSTGDWGSIPGSGRSHGEGNGSPVFWAVLQYSSILAWEIPWTGEPGRPQSTGLQESGDLATKPAGSTTPELGAAAPSRGRACTAAPRGSHRSPQSCRLKVQRQLPVISVPDSLRVNENSSVPMIFLKVEK